jgi:predicted transcriptional regulator
LEILRVLWQRGPSTVRKVQEDLKTSEMPGYTSVLKMLQIMHEKGLVDREEMGRAHLYRAHFAEETTKRRLVVDLMTRLFDGAAQTLVMHALTARKASPDELAEIRSLLERLESEEE